MNFFYCQYYNLFTLKDVTKRSLWKRNKSLWKKSNSTLQILQCKFFIWTLLEHFFENVLFGIWLPRRDRILILKLIQNFWPATSFFPSKVEFHKKLLRLQSKIAFRVLTKIENSIVKNFELVWKLFKVLAVE